MSHDRHAPRQPLVPEHTRVIGFIRPDDTKKILWILLAAIPTVIGATLVGYAYARLDAVDPVGVYAAPSARPAVNEPEEDRSDLRHAADRGDGSPAFAWLLFACGLSLVASGPLGAIVLLRRVWARDEWVLLRDDALVLQSTEGDQTFPWYDMERVCFDEAAGQVCCEMRDGDEPFFLPSRFDGGNAEETAARLETIRRKSSWGLL